MKFVCFSTVGVSLVFPLWICYWTFHSSRSYCLTWGKKYLKRKRKERKKKPPADFKPTKQVLLVFLDATGRGGLGFAFLPSYGFSRKGSKSGPQSPQLPSLQASSSVCCQATTALLHQACASNLQVVLSLRCTN